MNINRRRSQASVASRAAIALVMCLTLAPRWLDAQPSQAAAFGGSPERIVINDNRTAVGTMADGVLTVRLDARLGIWHPDSDSDPGVIVKAFAVDGGPLQIPGPVIRVREGAEIRVTVHNPLSDSLVVHGLYTRPGSGSGTEAVTIAPGETRERRFTAGRPGTYFYWGGTTADEILQRRSARDSQLAGALIVDPREGPAADDRILLISSWPANQGPGVIGRIAINGRSWPHTERLSYRVGDTVRMRLINAGPAVHPMHLHGFYFKVDSRGDERADTIFPPASSPRMVVTERLQAGRTFSLTWKPTRPGNWLFHCHDNVHLERGIPLDGGKVLPVHRHVQNHALEMMAGPVMGVTVTGRSAEPASAATRRRHLRLVARVDRDSTDAEPAYGYTLHTGSTTDAPPPPYLPGPTIVLKRGEPVSIIVKNELPEPTSVHWHGIELESYYDGVAGFAGEGRRIAPPIPSGGTFEARFTPPRAGTFIYHTHIDEVRQQQAGLSGALLVVDDPAVYNPEHDIVLLITVPRKSADAERAVLLNGSPAPPVKEMRVGQHYRLRFINIHTFRPGMRMRLLRDSTLLEWRAMAKDGMQLPADQAIMSPAEIQMGNGETYDFEFVPTAAGDLHLDVTNAAGVVLASMPVRVQ